MCELESVEMHPLRAGQYRRLWLDSAHELGLVAETLAEALGWQPAAETPLPDALELAEVAARRITELERIIGTARHRSRAHTGHCNIIVLN